MEGRPTPPGGGVVGPVRSYFTQQNLCNPSVTVSHLPFMILPTFTTFLENTFILILSIFIFKKR